MSYVSCSHAHRAHINPQLCLYLFSFVVKRVAGNLRCGKRVWSTMTRFSGFPSSLPPCAHTYRAQPCPSFLSWDPITLYPGFFPPSLPQLLTETCLLIQASCMFYTFLQSPLQNSCKRCCPFCQHFKSSHAGAARLSRLMLR